MKRKTDNSNKNLKKILVFFASIILIVIIIRYTFSRFQNDVNAVATMDAAFYIVNEDYQSMNINLGAIEPRNQKYEYNFSISNFEESKRAEVNLEYDLVIVTTTNLPLEYELFMNGNNTQNVITSDVTNQDSYGTYFRTLKTDTQVFEFTSDETNTYKLTIYFPPTYKDIKYQDVIEGIEIQVNSRQIIE